MRSLSNGLDLNIGGFFHWVYESYEGGKELLNLNITLGNNIGRDNPSSILKIQNLDIKILEEHKLARTLEHLILGNISPSLGETYARNEIYVKNTMIISKKFKEFMWLIKC